MSLSRIRLAVAVFQVGLFGTVLAPVHGRSPGPTGTDPLPDPAG